MKFLKEKAQFAYNWRFNWKKLRAYWLECLSCTLVRQLGHSYLHAFDLLRGSVGQGKPLRSIYVREHFQEIGFFRGGGGRINDKFSLFSVFLVFAMMIHVKCSEKRILTIRIL